MTLNHCDPFLKFDLTFSCQRVKKLNARWGLHAKTVYVIDKSMSEVPAHQWKQTYLLKVKHVEFVRVQAAHPVFCFSLFKVKFGEPADLDSQELFGLICQFVHDFKKAHADIIWAVLPELLCAQTGNRCDCQANQRLQEDCCLFLCCCAYILFGFYSAQRNATWSGQGC